MQKSTDSQHPELSVVIVTICGASYLAKCLEALSSQSCKQPFEIIVAYDERLPDVPSLQKKYPHVQMTTVHGMQTPEELASIGLRETHGRIIALTEDHCIPDTQWCEQILREHASSYAAIGGAVEIIAEDALSWAFAYTDYYRYLNPVPEGKTKNLTVCNVSYKREKLNRIADVWQHHFHEVAVNRGLQHIGEVLYLSGKLVVNQRRILTFRSAIHERYSFGRLFGSRRAIELIPRRRLLYTVFAPAIPLLLLGRMFAIVLKRKRRRRIFFISLPYLIILTLSWSLGEFIGNVTGRPPQEVYVARN